MDNIKIIQITSGRGPAECCLAVALALKEMLKEIKLLGMKYEIIERVPGIENGTLVSACLKIEGKQVNEFTSSWQGSLLWIAQSHTVNTINEKTGSLVFMFLKKQN